VVETMIVREPLGARVQVQVGDDGRSIIRSITPA
jgi:hypothetical protein